MCLLIFKVFVPKKEQTMKSGNERISRWNEKKTVVGIKERYSSNCEIYKNAWDLRIYAES